jgi:hypothetical protein
MKAPAARGGTGSIGSEDDPGGVPRAARFRIAGHLFHIADPPHALAPFHVEDEISDLTALDPMPASEGEPPVRTVGWLGSREREVTARETPGGFLVSVEDAGEYVVGEGGGVVAPVGPRVKDRALYGEVILGPPLLLALAMRGTFCLHASAVARGGAGLAILGDSGQGKSTLARWLAERASGWTWLTDDITPIVEEGGGVRIEPAFPQLKVVGSPGNGSSPPVTLRGWVELIGTEGAPLLEPLGARDRFVTLSRSVAAARVFGSELAGRAFDACGGLARIVPGYRLHYPHRWDALPQVAALLAGLGGAAMGDGAPA